MDKIPETMYIRNNPESGTEDELQKKIRNAYYRFKLTDNCTSLLKEVLNHDVFHAYKDKKTKFGGSFWDVIQAGATYIHEPIGLFAPDPEAYNVFKPLFNVAIDELHLGFSQNDVQPKHSWGNYKGTIRNPDPTGQYIESTRIRLCRNIIGYPFASCLTRTLLKEIERKIVPVLKEMPCGLDGRYFPMEKLRDEVQKELREEHIMWNKPSRYLKAANVGRFWPTGRGIYMNKARNFFVWVGKDDHLRIISMSKGNNLQEVYERLIRGTMVLENHLDFVHDDRLGYLTFDPANLGTTLRASYLIRLPRLTEVGLVEKLAEKFDLEMRGTFGTNLPVKNGLYNISNKRRLGLTEYEAVMAFQLGITKLIVEEQKLDNELKHQILEMASIMKAEKSMIEKANKMRKKKIEKLWDSESKKIEKEIKSSKSSINSPSDVHSISSKKKGKTEEDIMEKISRKISIVEENKSSISNSSDSSSSVETVRRKSSVCIKYGKLWNKSILEKAENISTSSFPASTSVEETSSTEKKCTEGKSKKKSVPKNKDEGDIMTVADSNSSFSSETSKKKVKKGKSEKISIKSRSKSSVKTYDAVFDIPSSPSTLSSESTKKKGKTSVGEIIAKKKNSKIKNYERDEITSAIFITSSTMLEDVATRAKARERIIHTKDF